MRVFQLVHAESYPAVCQFLETQVEMQMADLRVLLQLPTGQWTSGCNFATTGVLLNLISGYSVCLFEASTESFTDRQGRGGRFKRLLEQYYPWDDEGVGAAEGSKWLYGVTRNPLTHSLGVQVGSVFRPAGIAKRPLTADQIETAECSSIRPDWLPTTLFKKKSESGESVEFLSVPTLYWGMWRLLERLTKDDGQMNKAEGLLSTLFYLNA